MIWAHDWTISIHLKTCKYVESFHEFIQESLQFSLYGFQKVYVLIFMCWYLFSILVDFRGFGETPELEPVVCIQYQGRLTRNLLNLAYTLWFVIQSR